MQSKFNLCLATLANTDHHVPVPPPNPSQSWTTQSRISPVVGMAAQDNQHTADSIGNQHKDDIQQCLLDMAVADSSEAPESSFGKRRAAQVWRRLRVLSYDSGYSDNAPPQQQAH